jgi:hypothetical protein
MATVYDPVNKAERASKPRQQGNAAGWIALAFIAGTSMICIAAAIASGMLP